MVSSDWSQAIEQLHPAANEFHKGNAAPMLEMFSQRQDVSVANPLGPPPCAAARTLSRACEDGIWKIVHRHADPITSYQPVESLIQR